MKSNPQLTGPLAFPHYLGPGTRDVTAALLFTGGLTVSLPTWPSGNPPRAFATIHEHVVRGQHPLHELFQTVGHYFTLTLRQSLREAELLSPLKSRVSQIVAVYPGNQAAYLSWEPLHAVALRTARESLSSPLFCCTAAIEFVWRIWELALETGTSSDSPTDLNLDAMLILLAQRAEQLGGPEQLLAEGLLNRFCLPKTSAVHLATSAGPAVDLLASVGRDLAVSNPESAREATREALAFFLFRQLVARVAQPLTGRNAGSINILMDSRAEELSRLRKHCHHAAADLLHSPPQDDAGMKLAVRDALERMAQETQALLALDRESFRNYLSTQAENPAVWTTVAGLLGSAVGFPSAVTATLAVSAFSLLGASAVKASRQRREILAGSDLAFLYYAGRDLEGA